MYYYAVLRGCIAILLEVDEKATFVAGAQSYIVKRFVECYPSVTAVEDVLSDSEYSARWAPVMFPNGNVCIRWNANDAIIKVDDDESARLYVELELKDKRESL